MEEPAAKRPRYSYGGTGGTTTHVHENDIMDVDASWTMSSLLRSLPSQPTLSADSWADVMTYLPFCDMLVLSVVGRFFLLDVTPLVRELTVTTWREMHPSPPARFSGLREINVTCLIVPAGTDGFSIGEKHSEQRYSLCETTADLLVGFLSSFPRLERAWVGGVERNAADGTSSRLGYNPTLFRQPQSITGMAPPSGHQMQTSIDWNRLYGGKFRNLIDIVCQGYRTGLLSKDMHIRGLVDFGPSSGDAARSTSKYRCCTSETDRRWCKLCRKICQFFPLLHVIKLDRGCECLSFEERLAIVAGRPGGHEAIVHCSIEATFDRHKHGPLWIVQVNAAGEPSQDGPYRVDAIHFNSEMFRELNIALQYGIDPSEYDFAALEEHLPIDWAALDDAGTTSSLRRRLFITESSFNALVALGFALNHHDFRRIIRPNEVRLFGMGGLLSLDRLPGSVGLLLGVEV